MSREIKFRGICISEGEFKGRWVYGDLLQKNGKAYITPHSNAVRVDGHVGKMIIMHEVDPDTVGQYAGKNDDNGVDLYEGDITKIDDTIGIIEFDETLMAYTSNCKKDKIWWDLGEMTRSLGIEVIGNIYENPELLETA